MTHISRPFQIALLAMGLFAAVWFVALRGQSGSTGGSGSSPAGSTPAQAGKATAPGGSAPGSAAAPTPIYHGAAPGVAGLTRAIAKAHEAVAASQQNAKQVEQESPQAPGAPSPGSSTPSSATGSAPPATSSNTTAGAAATQKVGAHPLPKHAAAPASAANGAASRGANTPSTRSSKTSPPAMQVAVERELKQGKVATILFWNPKATVDQSVHRELQAAGGAFGGKVAIHNATAAQVGSFGSITRTVQVFQTPTILIVNPRGRTTTLMGLEDAFSIEQAIVEARRA
jgi:hypothetical protein